MAILVLELCRNTGPIILNYQDKHIGFFRFSHIFPLEPFPLFKMASKMAAKMLIHPKYYDKRFLNGFLSYWIYSESIKISPLKMDEKWVISKMASIDNENRYDHPNLPKIVYIPCF